MRILRTSFALKKELKLIFHSQTKRNHQDTTRFKIHLTRANNYVYFQTSWQNIALLLMKTANGPFIKVTR